MCTQSICLDSAYQKIYSTRNNFLLFYLHGNYATGQMPVCKYHMRLAELQKGIS